MDFTANYGYNNENYSTTKYGAQGGSEGGGFLGGTQMGSQTNPEGSKTYGKDTLRPLTIKQIIEAQQPHPDSEFKIDGVEVTQLTFVGQIQTVSSQATNTTYKVDDGTGLIEVKQWIDGDADPDKSSPFPKEKDYIRIWGRLRAFNNRRHVGAHMIRLVTDFNEITYHLLEATAVHLYFTRGPPTTGNEIKNESSSGIFVHNVHGGTGEISMPHGARKLPSNISMTSRKVYNFLLNEAKSNEGLHVSLIAQKLNLQVNDAYKAGDELLGAGAIYTTVDDETWAILEY
ncbi:putative replication protein a 32 kda subunit [Erysiphe necator]|uniref:Putative replication protein a 32 kDa subunit n=1 Tax=Uncinula necator TaxID=52586 RepID=A0A0B1PFQ9_UNCNE|nr:putative replication protein a 32 kda subunit [Erysiphe necator]